MPKDENMRTEPYIRRRSRRARKLADPGAQRRITARVAVPLFRPTVFVL